MARRVSRRPPDNASARRLLPARRPFARPPARRLDRATTQRPTAAFRRPPRPATHPAREPKDLRPARPRPASTGSDTLSLPERPPPTRLPDPTYHTTISTQRNRRPLDGGRSGGCSGPWRRRRPRTRTVRRLTSLPLVVDGRTRACGRLSACRNCAANVPLGQADCRSSSRSPNSASAWPRRDDLGNRASCTRQARALWVKIGPEPTPGAAALE